MFRYVALVVFLALPLSCASGGSTTEEGAPAPTTERRAVGYIVGRSASNPGFEFAIDCSYRITYRSSEGMVVETAFRGSGNWAGGWDTAVSGDTAVMTVQRTAGANSVLYLWIRAHGSRTSDRMYEGQLGPVTLKAVVP